MATVKTILPPEKAETRLRIAPYCRVSSSSDEQQHSFSAQVQYYTALVEKHPEWELVDIYADEGISGISTERREEFQRLMLDCARGKIDRIITKSVSRFARNTVDCLSTVRQLSALGVSVLFEKEQIDTAKMSSEIMLAMSGIQAQEESVSISNNMQWSYEKRMKNGDFISCHAPYGYRLNGSKLEIEPETAAVVEKIFQMYLSGIGTMKIAEQMNHQEIPCRHEAKKWYPSSIRYILTNERYAGDALLQKKYTIKSFPHHRVRNHGEHRQYYVENSHDAIISKEDFERVRYRLAKNNRKAGSSVNHSLSHLLVCPDCGGYFRRFENGNIPYWKCAKRNTECSSCRPIRVDEEDILAAIERMRRILKEETDILKKLLSDLELAQAKINGTSQKVYELDCKIAGLARKLHKIASMQTAGILDPADFTAQTAAVNRKLSALRHQRSQLLRQSENEDSIAKLQELCDTILDTEWTMPTNEQNFHSIVKKSWWKAKQNAKSTCWVAWYSRSNCRRRNGGAVAHEESEYPLWIWHCLWADCDSPRGSRNRPEHLFSVSFREVPESSG